MEVVTTAVEMAIVDAVAVTMGVVVRKEAREAAAKAAVRWVAMTAARSERLR